MQLTENQKAIWYDQIARPHSPVYNIGGYLLIYGHVDKDLLQQAIQYLVTENPILRTRITHTRNGQLITSVKSKQAVEFPFLDFSTAQDPTFEANEWLSARFTEAFDVDGDGCYWQFALLKLAERKFALLTKYHHVIADGWSTKIVIDRLATLYNCLLAHSETPCNGEENFADFVALEKSYLESPTYQRDAQFWQEQIPQIPDLLLREKYQANRHVEATRAVLHRFRIPRTLYNQLEQWAQTRQSTCYHLLLTTLCVYFARAQQQPHITVGLPSLNRAGARFKNVLGMFASLSPLSIDIDFETCFDELLKQFSAAIRKVHKHQRFPLSAINQRLHLLKNKRDSLFDLVLSYERQDYSVKFGEAEVEACQLFSGVARYPLAVTVCEFSAQRDVEIVFEAAETCFNQEELAYLSARFIGLLRQVTIKSQSPLWQLDLVPYSEKEYIFNVFNRRQVLPDFVSIIGQFKQWVANTPDAIAVRLGQKQLTYRELDGLSDRLGHELQLRHCGAGSVVAVCMPRSLETIVSFLAVLKIRAVYLPLDCESPPQRIAHLLCQGQASALLAVTQGGVSVSGLHTNIVWVDQNILLTSYPLSFSHPQPEDTAYLIFTSGSTGQPKGVKIHHRALSLRLAWLQQQFHIKPGEHVGQNVQTHFDPALIEIGLSLTQGACLILAPWQRPTPEDFARFVIDEAIHALALVPGSLKVLLQGLPADERIPLRVACCGGETLPAGLAAAFIKRTDAKLFNVYGPTETTILASAWQCSVDDVEPLPIGSPIDHTCIFVVDKRMRLLPLGVHGEIVIGGSGVGKGYLNQEALTAHKFVANPFDQQKTGSVYRSGDCGYIGTDGRLYFSERLDRQVKLGGYRIEPGEVETALLQHSEVQRAAVAAHCGTGQKMLVAYVESQASNPTELQRDLYTLLRHRLPDYMIPKLISVMPSLPTTAVGKIAYDQLPLPAAVKQASLPRLPANTMEAKLLEIWRQVLKNPQLNVEDNFFEQDSDSLTAISLIVAIEKSFGYRQTIAFLLEFPTVAEQAAQLCHAHPERFDRECKLPNSERELTHFYLAASGEGDYFRFRALADKLGNSCKLHILNPPRVDNGVASIEEIARGYAALIAQHKQHTFYLGGFSIGGITALETARILGLHYNLKPECLILLDSVYPRGLLRSGRLFSLLKILVKSPIFQWLNLDKRRLTAMVNDPAMQTQIAGLAQHRLQPYEGRAVLLSTSAFWPLKRLLFCGWTKIFKDPLEMRKVSGMHGGMFLPLHLPTLSKAIKACLQDPAPVHRPGQRSVGARHYTGSVARVASARNDNRYLR